MERASAAPLLYLRNLPRAVVPILLVGLALGGLLWSGPGGFALLLVVAVFLGWLVALSWPLLSPAHKALRITAVLVVMAAAAYQLV